MMLQGELQVVRPSSSLMPARTRGARHRRRIQCVVFEVGVTGKVAASPLSPLQHRLGRTTRGSLATDRAAMDRTIGSRLGRVRWLPNWRHPSRCKRGGGRRAAFERPNCMLDPGSPIRISASAWQRAASRQAAFIHGSVRFMLHWACGRRNLNSLVNRMLDVRPGTERHVDTDSIGATHDSHCIHEGFLSALCCSARLRRKRDLEAVCHWLRSDESPERSFFHARVPLLSKSGPATGRRSVATNCERLARSGDPGSSLGDIPVCTQRRLPRGAAFGPERRSVVLDRQGWRDGLIESIF